MILRSPYPWFGGKRRAAVEIWQALGNVDHYIEPFFGSGAVLLARPHDPKVETINDLDGYVCNAWRAIQRDPDAVAGWAIGPVNEIDLTARHRWLCERERKASFIARMLADPDYYDAQIAGWWLWGICAWIGGNWCTGTWNPDGDAGTGVHRKLPHLGDAGKGVYRKLPHLGNAGKGVHRQLPHLGNAGTGDPLDPGNVRGYMADLCARMASVRVCNGDWKRVLTPAAMGHGCWPSIGVLLDPPYMDGTASDDLYAAGGAGISAEVAAWAFEAGANPKLRIVLCGYEVEHTIPPTWRTIERREHGGYGNLGKLGKTTNDNRHRERLWLSPGCLVTADERQGRLSL